jgi:LmbE family N-acetylglucosaminyl deacetylase
MEPFDNGAPAGRASSAIENVQADNSVQWDPGPYERIMVLAPHPDDEALAAGGMIAKVLNSNGPSKVRVIVVTNGDASYATVFLHGSHLSTQKNFQRQAFLRQQESLKALAVLGLDPGQVRFWGFPDRGLAALWDTYWNNQPAYRSSTTGYDKSTQASNSPVLPFSGTGLDELLGKEFLEFQPTLIIMPHPQDHHSDHRALAGFTLRAVRQYPIQTQFPSPTLFAYWMWRDLRPWLMKASVGDLAHFSAGENSSPAGSRRFILSPNLQEQKARALRCYRSQRVAAGKLFHDAAHRGYETFTVLQPVQ